MLLLLCVCSEGETEALYEWTRRAHYLALFRGIDLTCLGKKAPPEILDSTSALSFSLLLVCVRCVGFLASERVFELFFFFPASSVWYRDVRASSGRSFWEIFSLSERVTFCPGQLQKGCVGSWPLRRHKSSERSRCSFLPNPFSAKEPPNFILLLPPILAHLSSVDNVCKQR